MITKSGHKILWQNHRQRILWNHELCGQVSDGHWENASPYGHYKVMCNARSLVNQENPGLNFYPRRKYGFSSSFLIECVGDRMMFYVKCYKLLGHQYEDLFNNLETAYNDGMARIRGYAAEEVGGYWSKMLIQIDKFLDDKFNGRWADFEYELDQIEYTEKDLRKDLRAMSKLVNSKCY